MALRPEPTWFISCAASACCCGFSWQDKFLALLTSCVLHCAFDFMLTVSHIAPTGAAYSGLDSATWLGLPGLLWNLCGSIHNPVVLVFCIPAKVASCGRCQVARWCLSSVCLDCRAEKWILKKQFSRLACASSVSEMPCIQRKVFYILELVTKWVQASSWEHIRTQFLWCNWPDFF